MGITTERNGEAPGNRAMGRYAEPVARALFHHTPVGVLLADPQSFYLDANPAACAMFGYTRQDFAGLHASDIVVQAEKAHIQTAIDEAGRAGHGRIWHFRRRDGSVFAADVIATALPDGNMLGLISDRSDAELRDQSRHLAEIVRSSGDAIVAIDLDGRVTSWNGGAENTFGFTAAEIVGGSIYRIVPEGFEAEQAAMLAALKRGETVPLFETVRRTRTGRLIDIAVTVAPLVDPEGRLAGAAGVSRDVTMIKKRERDLARPSRLYTALRRIGQAILRASSRDELFQRVCAALVEDGGFDTAWVAWHFPETGLLAPVVRFGASTELVIAADLNSKDESVWRGQARTTFRSGKPYICNDLAGDHLASPERIRRLAASGVQALAMFPIRLAGEVCGVLGVFADQIEVFRREEIILLEGAADDLSFGLDNLLGEEGRREVEAALRDEKRFSDSMIEAMPGIVCLYDPDGRFLRWNRNFEAVTGYTAEEVGRLHARDLFRPADHPALEAAIAEAFAGGETSLTAPLLAKDGTATAYHFTGTRVAVGGLPCLVGVGIDMTEREKRYRAEAADRVKSAFLATMSHELRTPLNSILGFTGMLLQGLVGPLNDEQARQLGMVRNSGRHLLDLINDILDISKIEAGELEVQAKPFDPEESIRRVAGLMRPAAESKGLTFTVETTRLPAVVVGDRRRVEQVLLNLISNAVKFTEAGQVTVIVDTVPVPGAGDALRMQVGDTGIGIRNEDFATLFQPFRQVDAGPSRQFEGTGLGLAICRRLSDLMGGTISVASEWGRGSTFTFSLPTTPTPAAGDEPPSAPHRGQ